MTDFTVFNVVVYGAGLHALAFANYAADYGAKVVCLEPHKTHIGGMTTGGLGKMDSVGGTLSPQTRWGRWIDFTKYISSHPPYNNNDGSEVTVFRSTEAIAAMNAIFRSNSNVTVKLNQRLKRVITQAKTNRIIRIELENGDTYACNYFFDATYEVDLCAKVATVRTKTARDSQAIYNEKVQKPDKSDSITHPGLNMEGRQITREDLTDTRGDLYPNRTKHPLSYMTEGESSQQFQAFGFRYHLSNRSDRRPWPKPYWWDEYHTKQIVDYITQPGRPYTDENGATIQATAGGTVTAFGLSLAETSNTPEGGIGYYTTNGADFPGVWTHGWHNRSYDERDAVAKYCAELHMGANWTMANDVRIPVAKRNLCGAYGLPADEYSTDYIAFPGHPPYFYVRDCRVFIGQYFMTTDNMFNNGNLDWEFADSISVGGYNTDFHTGHYCPSPDGYSFKEGGLQYTGVREWEISLRTHLPHRAQCPNLAVGWGSSGSTMFRSSARIEGTMAGACQALGILFGMAFQANVDIHDIPYSDLRVKLLEAGAILRV